MSMQMHRGTIYLDNVSCSDEIEMSLSQRDLGAFTCIVRLCFVGSKSS